MRNIRDLDKAIKSCLAILLLPGIFFPLELIMFLDLGPNIDMNGFYQVASYISILFIFSFLFLVWRSLIHPVYIYYSKVYCILFFCLGSLFFMLWTWFYYLENSAAIAMTSIMFSILVYITKKYHVPLDPKAVIWFYTQHKIIDSKGYTELSQLDLNSYYIHNLKNIHRGSGPSEKLVLAGTVISISVIAPFFSHLKNIGYSHVFLIFLTVGCGFSAIITFYVLVLVYQVPKIKELKIMEKELGVRIKSK